MNHPSGGVNPAAVEAMAVFRGGGAEKLGRVVWLPSINSRNHHQRFIEHAYIGVFLGPQSSVPRFQAWRGASVEQMAAAIRAVGAESSILGSDMGAAPLEAPINGFVAFVKRLGELGVSDPQLDRMTRVNPSALLGI